MFICSFFKLSLGASCRLDPGNQDIADPIPCFQRFTSSESDDHESIRPKTRQQSHKENVYRRQWITFHRGLESQNLTQGDGMLAFDIGIPQAAKGKSSIPGWEYLAYAEAQGFEKAQHGENYKFINLVVWLVCRGLLGG